MKYSKSHFQGGRKFSLMCINASDKKHQIVMQVLAFRSEKIKPCFYDSKCCSNVFSFYNFWGLKIVIRLLFSFYLRHTKQF